MIHAFVFIVGLGIAALDPELNADPNVLLAVGGALLCLLLPDVISLGLGALAGLLGQRARTTGVSGVTTVIAAALVLWPLARIALDLLTCQCSTIVLYVLPLIASITALVFVGRGE